MYLFVYKKNADAAYNLFKCHMFSLMIAKTQYAISTRKVQGIKKLT